MKYEDFTASASGSTPLVVPSQSGWYPKYGKRVLDLVIALLLLPFFAPLIALLCALSRSDGAPGLFEHVRVGQNGKKFKCLKIRTMVPDAERRLTAYLSSNPEASEEWSRTQKLTNDPRVTPQGQFLRKTSLDELPQIWNVLRGEMSLVGPRPVTEPELERYGPHKQVYLNLKPGITGLWQVSGRGTGCYDERLLKDRSYAENIGALRDLALVARTVAVLVRPTGR